MVSEVLLALNIEKLARLKDGFSFVDATLGQGGHSVEVIKKGGSLLGIDLDEEALTSAKKKLISACPASYNYKKRIKLVSGNFVNIDKIAKESDVQNVDAILVDLGVSSPQITSDTRGFSFRNESAILDMRLSSKTQGVTAYDLLNSLDEHQLRDLFNVVLSTGVSYRISKEIVKWRKEKLFRTVGDFVEVIKKTIFPKNKTDVSTLPFLALRIAVNSELENIKEALPKMVQLLKTGGRLAIISFHSKEDEIVKHLFLDFENQKMVKILTKKPISPSLMEIENNPRARSSKLRVIEKI